MFKLFGKKAPQDCSRKGGPAGKAPLEEPVQSKAADVEKKIEALTAYIRAQKVTGFSLQDKALYEHAVAVAIAVPLSKDGNGLAAFHEDLMTKLTEAFAETGKEWQMENCAGLSDSMKTLAGSLSLANAQKQAGQLADSIIRLVEVRLVAGDTDIV